MRPRLRPERRAAQKVAGDLLQHCFGGDAIGCIDEESPNKIKGPSRDHGPPIRPADLTRNDGETGSRTTVMGAPTFHRGVNRPRGRGFHAAATVLRQVSGRFGRVMRLHGAAWGGGVTAGDLFGQP